MSLVVAILLPSLAQATVLADWSLEERARRADCIVIGVVGDSRSVLEDGRILTETVIEVEQTLAGAPTDELVLTQLGGRWGKTVAEVIGTARLPQAGRVLLFLEQKSNGRFVLVAMALGAYVLGDDGQAYQVVDVPLVQPDGSVRPPPGAQTVDMDRIDAAVRARAP